MRTIIFQRTSAALALALTLLTSTVARAGDPSPDAIAKSSALYTQARALQVRGKWAEAEAAYQAAWDLRRTFDIAGNLGDCELHVGQPREAAEHLAYALRNVPAGVTAEQSEALKGLLKQAQQQVGTLRVTVNVGGAQVVVDGRAIEDAGGEVFVTPGVRTIEARLAGYAAVQKTVSVGAGASEKVELVLVAQKRSVVPGAVLGGVAGAALVSGIAFTVVSNGHRTDSLDAQKQIDATGKGCVKGANPTVCVKLDDALSKTDTFRKLAVAGYVGAGIAAVAATTYLLWPAPKSRGASGLRVFPLAGPAIAGLMAEGEF